MCCREKPRLMLIGYAYMIAFNREKAKALSKYFDVHVCTMLSDGIKVLGKEVRDEVEAKHQASYTLSRLKWWPTNQTHTKVFLRGIRHELVNFNPDYVLLEDEPWSIMRWQVRYDCWRVAPKAKFVEFTWENVRRTGWKGIVGDFVYSLASFTAGKVICGNVAARSLFQNGGLANEKIHVDGQVGISKQACRVASQEEKKDWRLSIGWQESDVVIGYCGRMVAEKGVFELVEAVQNLRQTYPNLRLAMLGAGASMERVKDLDTSEQWLKVLAPVEHAEVPDFLNKLDVFVLPSKPVRTKKRTWEEQFGHVLIEAMACGTFTIGSDSGAIPEVLNDPNLVFKHSDSESLEELMNYYLTMPDVLRCTAITQRVKCIESWSHEALALRYAKFIAGKEVKDKLI